MVVIELQHPGERLEHLRRRISVASTLQAEVVVGADPGEHRDLLAPQARDATHTDFRDTRLIRRHEPAPRFQILPDSVRTVCHAVSLGRAGRA